MKAVNERDRNKNMSLFVLMLFVTGGLVFLLFSSSKRMAGINIASNKMTPSITAKEQGNVLREYDEVLHNKLNYLEQLDEQYAALVASSSPGKNYDSLNSIIIRGEADFSTFIDEAGKKVSNKKGDTLFSKMIMSFQSALQHRKSIGYLRNAVAIAQSNFTPEKNALLTLQNELMTKAGRITLLENSLVNLEKKQAEMQPLLIGSQNEKFADSIKFVAAINVLELKATSLTTANNNLKQDIAGLQKQNESIKTTANNETSLKEKANTLQQRLDAVNAELQLAHVDCNLSRVDAKQIISTAKQRQQLLNEASTILTDLTNSNSPDVKRKAQDKIVQLNQVAANSRD